MSKLRKPKSCKDPPSSTLLSQFKISSFFQKNAVPANNARVSSIPHPAHNAVSKNDNSTQLQHGTETRSVISESFVSPVNPFPRKVQSHQIDSDPDDCMIPDTPENSLIHNISRLTDISRISSFRRNNIISSEVTSKEKSNAATTNISSTGKNRSGNSVPRATGLSAHSILKRSSDSCSSSSKRSDFKTTPRKSVDSYRDCSVIDILCDNKRGEDYVCDHVPSKKDDFIRRPQSNTPFCRILSLDRGKHLSKNPQNVKIDLNSDAELQRALSELSQFNHLDISERKNRKKNKSEELSDISNESPIADTQLIVDFSPVNDNKVSFQRSSIKPIVVQRRLTDSVSTSRRPLKQMENLDTLINECVKPVGNNLDPDALLLSTLKELNEYKPVDISKTHNVRKDKQSNIVVVTNQNSKLIDESIDVNAVNSCEETYRNDSNVASHQETNVLSFERDSASVDAINAVDSISVSNRFENTLSINDSSVEVNALKVSNIQNDLDTFSLVQTNPMLQNKFEMTETAINKTTSLPSRHPEIIDKQTSDKVVGRYKPAFHEFGRHNVVNVTKYPKDTILDLIAVSDGRLCQVSLMGFWQDTIVSAGDTVNIIGSFDLDSVCRVTDKENFIVVNPDMLVSGTTIVSTMRCMRRSVLGQKFKGSDPGNDAMLYGSILHAIFQEVLVERASTQAQVADIVERVLTRPEFLHEMYAQDVREKNVRSEILKYCPEIDAFIGNHVRRNDFKPPTSNVKVNSSNKSPGLPMFIVNVVDVEENLWSPRYGVKGKIDLTVEVMLQNERKQWTNAVIPLELKTGKATFSSEHQGQVVLYTMMSEDRRPRASTSGLLLYLKGLAMQLVTDNHAQKRGLVQLRNEFAHYVKQSQQCENVPSEEQRQQQQCNDDDSKINFTFGSLPPPINDDFSCNKCPQLLNCSLYQNRLESHALKPTHIMLKLVPESLAHLRATHLDFFSLWCQMLHLEMTSSNAEEGGVSGLWMNTGEEAEALGKCLSQLEIVTEECRNLGYGKYQQVFRPATGHFRDRRLCDVGLASGSSLTVSAENKPYIALTTGLVTSITEGSVTLVTDRDLRLYPDYRETIYRLDNCDTYNSMSTSLTNLSRLMENKAVCEKLRELVIERRPPQFQLTLSKVTINKVKDVFKQLNKPQKAAVLKIMMAKDYVLMKGYPGTGKTSTIVALVRIMTLLGQSVLLTSYTHSAVDNILLKLKQANVDFLRIGRLERVHPELHEYTAERLQQSVTTVDQLDELYRSKSVLATTCLAMNHAIFTRRRFDICVVDEATQVLLPACLSSLFVADRFVLVGDPKQLPPIVHNKQAKQLGMDRSLFTHLEDAGGTYSLTLQYRMNAEIMRLSNALTYDGALNCANSAVAEGRLKINASVVCSHDWLHRCVSNQPGDVVLWLNTDSIIQPTEQNKDSVTSDAEFHSKKSLMNVQSSVEAEIVRSIVRQLMLRGVPVDDIGVITPYRQQVLLLRQTINGEETRRDDLSSITSASSSASSEQVEINTVDQYQGRDKPVIIVSFVKSRDGHASEILKDARRLNVAITRAKHKLVFVGSIETLSSYEYLRNLITNVLTANQIVTIT